MENEFNWNMVIDRIQFAMLWFIVAVVVVCIIVLILFDVLAGAGIMVYLTNKNIPVSFFISMATTGLLVSLMFIAYSLAKKKSTLGGGWVIGLISFGVYCIDVYFDSLAADYLRFGEVMALSQIPNPNIHLLFRFLLGGISTVGETLALSIILGMPVLKEVLNRAIPDSLKYKHPHLQSQGQRGEFQNGKYKAKHRPHFDSSRPPQNAPGTKHKQYNNWNQE